MSYQAHEGLQVAVQNGLEVPVFKGPEIRTSDNTTNGDVHSKPSKISNLRKPIFISTAALVLIIIIVGAVVGGVVGSKMSRKSATR